jgi:hypothetical protein
MNVCLIFFWLFFSRFSILFTILNLLYKQCYLRFYISLRTTTGSEMGEKARRNLSWTQPAARSCSCQTDGRTKTSGLARGPVLRRHLPPPNLRTPFEEYRSPSQTRPRPSDLPSLPFLFLSIKQQAKRHSQSTSGLAQISPPGSIFPPQTFARLSRQRRPTRGMAALRAPAATLLVLLALAAAGGVAADGSDHRYKIREPVPLYANKVGPFHNPR